MGSIAHGDGKASTPHLSIAVPGLSLHGLVGPGLGDIFCDREARDRLRRPVRFGMLDLPPE